MTRGIFLFPLAGQSWADHSGNADLRGADEGTPGELGWRYPRSSWHLHRGVDLPAQQGAAIIAVEAGWAMYRGANSGARRRAWNAGGNRVELRGGSGAMYLYLHMGTSHESVRDAFPQGVSGGDVVCVQAGEVIGFAGYTGGNLATGMRIPPSSAHLHFQFHPTGEEQLDYNPNHFFELADLEDPLKALARHRERCRQLAQADGASLRPPDEAQ
jgi:murein DD-endopeptidase MepM/ murein hydrolase activator NlpD